MKTKKGEEGGVATDGVEEIGKRSANPNPEIVWLPQDRINRQDGVTVTTPGKRVTILGKKHPDGGVEAVVQEGRELPG